MSIVEISDKARITELLSDDPIETLEALDENIQGVEGLVTIFAPDVDRPANYLVLRWGQKSLGLGSYAMLRAGRFSGLDEVAAALPTQRSQFDLLLPFWASPAVGAALVSQPTGAMVRYRLDRGALTPSAAVRQCQRLDEPRIVKPMFPKLEMDAPIHVLSFGGELVSVAAVTHLQADVARVHVYTTEARRGHGFGRAVLTALSEELLALAVTPTLAIDLAQEPAVRMAERAGFRVHAAHLNVHVTGRQATSAPEGLVRLGGSE